MKADIPKTIPKTIGGNIDSAKLKQRGAICQIVIIQPGEGDSA